MQNNKDLLLFIFDQMEKLSKNEITTDHAKAQAALAKQANNSLEHELQRSRLLLDIETQGSVIKIRDIETLPIS